MIKICCILTNSLYKYILLDKNLNKTKLFISEVNMKNRNQIDPKYQWDIGLFKNEEDIERVFASLEKLTRELPKYNGKFSDKNKFFEYFEKYKPDFILIGQLGFYLNNSFNVDSSNTKILKLMDRFEVACDKLNIAISFVSPQLEKLDEAYLKELLLDKRAKNLSTKIRNIIKAKAHHLDEKTSEICSKLSNAFENSSDIFDIFTDSEMPFRDALDSSNKTHKVNNNVYSSLISSNDRTLRKNAYNSMMDGFGSFNKTFAELYLKSVKAEKDLVKLRKYDSVLDYALESEDVPMSVYKNNIDNVVNHIPLLQNIIKFRAKNSGLKSFAYYDLFLKDKNAQNFTIEKSQQIVKEALAPLGEEYLKLVDKKFSDQSIDYLPNKNKNSGGYCSNSPKCKTLILMNWNNNYDSLSTLIHEMGHCINAEYFNMAQPYEKAGISIFAAEIASTVNEILLNQYMLSHCEKNEKATYLWQFLSNVRSTIYRQTLFSEFELYVHTMIEQEKSITYEDLNNKYYELNQKYYGKSCVLPKNLAYEWSRIPHFYNSYYVYSYSTGLITAICIASKILEDHSFTEKYIHFLKNGDDEKAVDVLKSIGIDLTTNEPFDIAFKFIEKQFDAYKKSFTKTSIRK